MRASIEWLKEFVDITETPGQLADIFTLLGAEVETIDGDVLDLEVTPNRPDWLSIYGLAREYAASSEKQLKTYTIGKENYKKKSHHIDLVIANPRSFPRYSAILLEGITIKPANAEIQKRLKAVGINVHNNIVDIANYVMVETGMPLHAFDADSISGHKMILRQSTAGEKIKTLDEKTYELPAGTLVIEDGKQLIDLCGIKGATASAITDKTKRILLHAVVYDPKRIRQTRKKIGLSTNASYRFERGVDQQATTVALDRAIKLIVESCGGRIAEKIDIVNVPLKPQIIEFYPKRIVQLLGTSIPAKTAFDVLNRLGFKADSNRITVPSWRLHDVKFEEDVIEEIARLYGYNKLAKRVLKPQKSKLNTQNQYQQSFGLKKYLGSQGFREVLAYSLVSKVEAGDRAVKLANPISPETEYLRTSLAPGLIKVIAKNPWMSDVNIFEIGRVFGEGKEADHVAIASTKKLPFDIPAQTIAPNHPLTKLNKLRRAVYIAELSYSNFLKNVRVKTTPLVKPAYHRTQYRPVSLLPPVVRDIAIVVNRATKPVDVIEAIKNVDDRALLVELFDEFESEKFGTDKKSLAFHIVFDNPKKTMNDEKTAQLMAKIVSVLGKKFSAKVR